jgi:hypothetical protein
MKHGPFHPETVVSLPALWYPLLSLRAPVTDTRGACLFASLPFNDSSLATRSITIDASHPSRPRQKRHKQLSPRSLTSHTAQFAALNVPVPVSSFERSRMAVLIQKMKLADCSGVAFGRDPRNPQADCVLVEAVPDQCALLVDGSVDADRWPLQRSTGQLIEYRPGNRGQATSASLLELANAGVGLCGEPDGVGGG